MLEQILRHFDQASIFGASSVLVGGLLAVNLTLTLVHALQELRGRLWRYFGAIAGVHISDAWGVGIFFIILTGVLWFLGWGGITGYLPGSWPRECLAALSIGVLIGGRLSDRRYSHVRLDRKGYRPNPGLQSTPFYLIEAVLLTVVFMPLLIEHPWMGALGFLAGWAVFLGVLPFIRWLRIFPGLRRERWNVGGPSPDWARLPRDQNARV